jgi:hypothetical protein
LAINGVETPFAPELEQAMIAIAAKELDKDGLAELLERCAVPVPEEPE